MMTTGLNSNHSMQRAPYLRAMRINVWSGFLLNVKNVIMLPKTGSARGLFEYGNLVTCDSSKINSVMNTMSAETKETRENIQNRVEWETSIVGIVE